MWISGDMGRSWRKEGQLTFNSEFNHAYVRRPVNAHPGFYGFWADGHGRQLSKSRLYFTDIRGRVYQLPEKMNSDMEKPLMIKR